MLTLKRLLSKQMSPEGPPVEWTDLDQGRLPGAAKDYRRHIFIAIFKFRRPHISIVDTRWTGWDINAIWSVPQVQEKRLRCFQKISVLRVGTKEVLLSGNKNTLLTRLGHSQFVYLQTLVPMPPFSQKTPQLWVPPIYELISPHLLPNGQHLFATLMK